MPRPSIPNIPESDCESFPPLIRRGAKVLVVGSMPGVISLKAQRYYANPHNLFWRVMNELAGAHPSLSYEDRVERLYGAGIAVWDTLKSCVRGGSLDSAIVRGSEVANDFAGLLAKHRTIRAIALNGGKARDVFKRLVLPTLDEQVLARVTVLEMPSTSPANASQTVEAKLERWRALEPYLR
jgi:TDG/mug DNA glycosylase family protein